MPQPRTPAATAAHKQESRHDQWWYPQRCEYPGCSETARDVLKKCLGCNMVMYCGTDHQKADWPAHKEECKLFQQHGLRSTFYTDEDMLAHVPLKPWGGEDRYERPPAGPGSCCGLCGRTDADMGHTKEPAATTDSRSDDEVELVTITYCCGQAVCYNSEQLWSNDRKHCQRCHERYTLCGSHGAAACDRDKDWRECSHCLKDLQDGADPNTVADRLWRGLSCYNFYPLLSKDVPRHGRCETCCMCDKKFMKCVTGGTRLAGGGTACTACRPF